VSETTQNAPAGWYPDPNAPGGQRWWDGTQWTDHVGVPAQQPYQPFAPLTAPAGTQTGTPWIWLVALLPLLTIPTLFLIDIQGYLRATLQNPASPSSMLALFTPGYLVAMLLGWATTIGTIVFAYLDWRALKRRGVPQPFHWAFSFLILASAGIVYPIGRSVVVKRRAGGSMAPMWVAIAVYALVIIVSIVWSIVLIDQVFASIPSYSSFT
jgi:hypothetical protein